MAQLPASSLPMLLFVAGILLTGAEALIPGAHFVVLGVALTIAGLLGLLVGPLASPLALAATTLLVGAATFWVYRNVDLYGGTQRGTPMDSSALKGREGTVTERVTPSGGQVKLDSGGFNPYYQATALDEEIPEGTDVIVVDPGGGNVVTVAPVSEPYDSIDRRLAAERERQKRQGEDGTTGGSADDVPTGSERASEEVTDASREDAD